MEIIRRTPFAELFRDRKDVGRVTNTFYRVILASFMDASGGPGMVAPTTDEIKRRFKICERWFRDLRGERKWTIDRCLAALPGALESELGGTHYEPDKRTLWVPGDGEA